MKQELIDLTLPEWGFISDGCSPDPWVGRDVLLHVRSMSVFEFFKYEDVELRKGVKKIIFWRHSTVTGKREQWVCILRIRTRQDDDGGEPMFVIMNKAVTYFENYLKEIEQETLNDLEHERLINSN